MLSTNLRPLIIFDEEKEEEDEEEEEEEEEENKNKIWKGRKKLTN